VENSSPGEFWIPSVLKLEVDFSLAGLGGVIYDTGTTVNPLY